MSGDRKGDWILTSQGVEFYPLDPRPEDVHLLDIAHALSNLCRFAGHVRSFYSVGDHSVLVADRVMAHWGDRPGRVNAGLAGLLHDGSEAYMIDVPRPLKRLPFMAEYRAHEEALQACIYARFQIEFTPEVAEVVHHTDNEVLATEKRDLMPVTSWEGQVIRAWGALPRPLDSRITPLSPLVARERFIHVFSELEMARNNT